MPSIGAWHIGTKTFQRIGKGTDIFPWPNANQPAGLAAGCHPDRGRLCGSGGKPGTRDSQHRERASGSDNLKKVTPRSTPLAGSRLFADINPFAGRCRTVLGCNASARHHIESMRARLRDFNCFGPESSKKRVSSNYLTVFC